MENVYSAFMYLFFHLFADSENRKQESCIENKVLIISWLQTRRFILSVSCVV